MINPKSNRLPRTIVCYKQRGETPLDVIGKLRAKNPELLNEKIGYAGRLDPMAEGVMIALVGDENKKKETYQNLNKEYEVQVVFGIETDSQDLLGMIEKIAPQSTDPNIQDLLPRYSGRVALPLPIYSGATKNGKKLFMLARSKALKQSETEKKNTTIQSIQIIENGKLLLSQLAQSALSIIPTIRGDFRQEEIIAQWETYAADTRPLPYCKLRVIASSGTYMRSLARALGQDVGVGAIAAHIVRTRIGPYTSDDEI